MTRPLESTVRAAVERVLEVHGGWYVKTWGSAKRAGLPDLLGCVRGRFVAIEVKRSPDEQPTRLQRVVLERIRRAGGIAIVASCAEDVVDALEPCRTHTIGSAP